MALDHGGDARFHAVDRQVETRAIRRRGRENEFVLADRKRHRPGAIVQRHLVLVALPLTEREYPLPPSDRHPAKRLPWLILARGLLLVADDGGNRSAELEIAERAG